MYAISAFNTTFINPKFVIKLLSASRMLPRKVDYMTAIVAYRNEISDDPDASFKMFEILGIDPGVWKIVFRGTVRGRSQILHYFDMVLESESSGSLVPVMFLKSTETNKSSKIMLHKVKSDDISSDMSYIMTDFAMDPKDKILCEMSHLRAVNLGSAKGSVLVSEKFHDAFYGIEEAVKRKTNDPIFSEKPKIFRRKNRDRTKIVQDVLESVLYMKSASITQLIYKCNLNYKSAKSLLNDMIAKDLLKIVEYSSIGRRYELTDRGRKMLERLQFYVNF